MKNALLAGIALFVSFVTMSTLLVVWSKTNDGGTATATRPWLQELFQPVSSSSSGASASGSGPSGSRTPTALRRTHTGSGPVALGGWNFQQEVLSSPQAVLVDFNADWCGPCRKMQPVVARLANDFADQAVVGECNIDRNPELARQYGIRSIPAFLIFRHGQVVERVIGSTSHQDLAQRLRRQM